MEDTQESRHWWARLFSRYFRYLWYVHPPVVLMIQADAQTCLKTLATAAKPSTQRLHLRNLFAQGRRYQIQPYADGFRLTTTSKVPWRYRQRTSSAAVMTGMFSNLNDDATRIQLRVRMHVGYLILSFVVPLFMTSILIYVPWNPIITFVALALIFALSLGGRRLNAMLEANEMVWFVQKALDDLGQAQIMQLNPAPDADVVHQDFAEEWQKFYREQQRSPDD